MKKLMAWLHRLTTRAPVTDTPHTLEAAFDQGFADYLDGRPNPHPPGSALAIAWDEGASEAFTDSNW